MTDRERMVEQIWAAMQAVDQAQAATETLRERIDREAVEHFQAKMRTLQLRLEQMQAILTHEDTYTLDELAEAVGAALSNRGSYHRIPHYAIEPKE